MAGVRPSRTGGGQPGRPRLPIRRSARVPRGASLIRIRGSARVPRGASLIRPGLLAAIALLVAFHAGVLIYHLAVTLAFPYDLNYGEGYVLFDAVRLSRGEPLYVDLQQFPMVRSPYPPLFPLVWSAVLPVTGPALWPGRALSVISLAALAVLVDLNARRVRREIWPGLAAVGLLLGSPFVYQWAGYARVDLLALAFAAGGVLSAQWIGGRRGTIIAAGLCGLALWTKQTAITAAVAVALSFAFRSRPRAALFVTLVGAPSVLLVLLLNATTNGEFTRHVLQGNASNPIDPLRAAVYIAAFAALHLPALAAGMWWLRRAFGLPPSPVAMYLLIALLAEWSAGNGGSSVNYLLEPIVAVALAVPFAWRAIPPAAALVGPLLAATQLAVLVHWPNSFGTTYLADGALGRTPTSVDATIGAHLDTLVRAEPGEVIAEPAGFAVRNGRPVYVQPIDLRAEQLQGRWQPGPLTDALTSGRFGLVITAFNFFPVEAEQVLKKQFTLVESLPGSDGLTSQVYRYHP